MNKHLEILRLVVLLRDNPEGLTAADLFEHGFVEPRRTVGHARRAGHTILCDGWGRARGRYVLVEDAQ